MSETIFGGASCCHRDQPWHSEGYCYATFRDECNQHHDQRLREQTWNDVRVTNLVITALIEVWGTPPVNTARDLPLPPLIEVPEAMPNGAAHFAWEAAQRLRAWASAYSALGYGFGGTKNPDGRDWAKATIAAACVFECLGRIGREVEPGRSVRDAQRLTVELCELVKEYSLPAVVHQCATLVVTGLDPAAALSTAQAVVA